MWTQKVATQFSLNKADLDKVYTADTNSAESRVRTMWKYAASRQITGTPMATVNGVVVQNFPQNADEWMTLLTDTYNSQYPKPSQEL